MPLPKRWNKKKAPPPGFDIIEGTLEALEHELRDKIKETNDKKRKTESMWPVHQIGWQKSRYVYDMFYTYHRISRQVYDHCLKQKLVDAALIAKWKKPGYERLCSTYVINPSNYKFGTTSICRVPAKDRGPEQATAQDPTTGCLGCASGKGAGPRNIFGNKYGQYLAAVQIAREERLAKLEEQKRLEAQQRAAAATATGDSDTDDGSDSDSDDDDDNNSDSDDDDDDDSDDDYGPAPAAGIWAGSNKLQQQSEQKQMVVVGGDNNNNGDDDNGDDETDDDDDNDDDESDNEDEDEGPAPPPKKAKTEA